MFFVSSRTHTKSKLQQLTGPSPQQIHVIIRWINTSPLYSPQQNIACQSNDETDTYLHRIPKILDASAIPESINQITLVSKCSNQITRGIALNILTLDLDLDINWLFQFFLKATKLS